VTLEERTHALQAFGFSERQARFLTMAALHGGYFLRRQYNAFSGLEHGRNVTVFLDRLSASGYAGRIACRPGRGSVFHLHDKRIYAALGQADNRNRRHVSTAQIARKLMLFDYVLAHLAVEWYATEEDKVELFGKRLGVPDPDLPRRVYAATRPNGPTTTRYFVEKQPIGLDPDSASVHFAYLVTDTTGAGFETFLQSHAKLLHRLSDWTLVSVFPPHVPGVGAVEVAFRRFVATPPGTAERERLHGFFRVRHLVEARRLQTLSVADLNNYREQRAEFAGADNEAKYAEWCRAKELASTGAPNTPSEQPIACRGRLQAYTLPHTYDHFGSLPGLC
jgi:hypothetical protein